MKLIDADVLMKAMYHRAFETDGDTMWQSGCWVRYRAIEQVIKEQPTIERKTGKWIERNPQNSDKCRLIECDQCGFAHIVGFNVPYEHWIENRNFCERCGADMRKKGEK